MANTHDPTVPFRESGNKDHHRLATPLGFRAYVVNLPKAVHRLRPMEKRLRKAGIPWTRIDAVNGRELDLPIPEFHEAWHRAVTGRRPIPAEIGCYLSHLKALQAFLATDDEFGLILEDDAVFDETFTATLLASMEHGTSWDILRLSSVNRDRALPVIALETGESLGVNLTRSKGAAAYMVNRKAARTLLDRLNPMMMAYDIAFDLEYLFGLKALAVTPLPIRQDTGFKTQIQVGIQKSKYSKARYLTVFPVRAWFESSRVVCRGLQYLRFATFGSKTKVDSSARDAASNSMRPQPQELRRAA